MTTEKEGAEGTIVQLEKRNGSYFENLDRLRVNQDFINQVGAEKMLTSVMVRKPSDQEWVRVHPDESNHLPLALFRDELDRSYYIIDRELVGTISDNVVVKVLYFTISRQNVPFLWPVKLHDASNRLDSWNESAHRAARIGMRQWIRVQSSMPARGYEVFSMKAQIEEPKWPDETINEILEMAFEGRIIKDYQNPILKSLRGEA